MKYQQATWRIRVAKNTYVEVSVKGCDDERNLADASDVIRSAKVLSEVGQAIRRIESRWALIGKASQTVTVA